jgi:hypothetical protein
MTVFRREGDRFVIAAGDLAQALGLSEAAVRAGLRDGTITSRTEMGMEGDAGRWRLTFFHGGRALRFTVDAEGVVQRQTRFPVRARPASGRT